jgi:hypothetical protein
MEKESEEEEEVSPRSSFQTAQPASSLPSPKRVRAARDVLLAVAEEDLEDSLPSLPADKEEDHHFERKCLLSFQLQPPLGDGLEFFGLDEVRKNLAASLKRAFESKEGLHVFLVGSSGTGKKHALRGALRDVQCSFKTIELDGSDIADDVGAVREITRTLGLTEHEALEVSTRSLEDEITEIQEQLRPTRRGNFSDHLKLLFKVAAERSSDRLVFVLKNFDAFCNRKKNTLLYALLDHTHSGEDKFVIVAECESLKCTVELDKRLRSRFENVLEFHFPNERLSTDGMLTLLRGRLEIKDDPVWQVKVDESLVQFRPVLSALLLSGTSVGRILQIVTWAVCRHKVDCPLDLCKGAGPEHPLSTSVSALEKEDFVLLLTAVYLGVVKNLPEFSFETLFRHSRVVRQEGATELYWMPTPTREMSFAHFDLLLLAGFFARRTTFCRDKYQQLVYLAYDDVKAGLLRFLVDWKGRMWPLSITHMAKRLLGEM